MNIATTGRAFRFQGVVSLAVLLLMVACARQVESPPSFGSAQEAVAALVTAVRKDDMEGLRKLLGPDTEDLLSSGDPVADQAERAAFLVAYDARYALVEDGADRMSLIVGEHDWPLPIPIVKRDARWYVDGAAGADEMIYRRVGGNELGAINVCRGFVAAQFEYAAASRDGDPAGIYAMKLVSDAGRQNGLYWETPPGEPPSPVGELVAGAASEGYRALLGARTPYHGYYYRMLYAQGGNANGGAREYFKDGVLNQGFALVAWPTQYGASGVQTFVVNQDGVVFQKDLGEGTAAAVEAMQSFDPDTSWTAIAPPASAVPADAT